MIKKKLGQHFLIDKNIAELEVKYASIKNNDVVLEIGPGEGILTKLLANKAKKVIAIEIDQELIKKLKPELPENVKLIHGDALKIDFNQIPLFNKIVANLPFQISSPITFKFLKHRFSKAVLIYQKDFAKRMTSPPKSSNYSRLSVGVYYKAHCKILKDVPKNCFFPQPKIDTCIVELIPRKKPPFHVTDERFFFDLTKKLFSHRRKKIKNTLREKYEIEIDDFPFLDKRVEELSPEQIGELSNLIFHRIST
jgi:16S rRNA (adenine1518-N6/adenine1519-N6)-dimethyltransferase